MLLGPLEHVHAQESMLTSVSAGVRPQGEDDVITTIEKRVAQVSMIPVGEYTLPVSWVAHLGA